MKLSCVPVPLAVHPGFTVSKRRSMVPRSPTRRREADRIAPAECDMRTIFQASIATSWYRTPTVVDGTQWQMRVNFMTFEWMFGASHRLGPDKTGRGSSKTRRHWQLRADIRAVEARFRAQS